MGVLQDLENTILSPQQLYDHGCPSASIAILEDGKISAHVIGDSGTGGNGDANTETAYQACSIAKAITSLGVARLADQGKLSYDTKLVDHVPRSLLQSIYGTTQTLSHWVDQVTIGMCLSHTAGFSQHGFPGHAGELPTKEDVILGRPPANTAKIALSNIPGSQWDYSGAGTVLTQIAIENLTGRPFADLMRELVLEPLQMTRSWYTDIPPGEKNFAKAHYAAYAITENGYHRWAERATAGLWSTPTDLLKAVLAVQDSLHSDSGFLKRETARKMLTEVHTSKKFGGIAMAWGVDDEIFGHSGGNDPGYCSYLFGFHGGLKDGDDKKLEGEAKGRNGISVMLNCLYINSVLLERILGAIYYLKGWTRFEDLTMLGDDNFAPFPAPAGTKIDDTWKEYVGKYEDNWEVIDQDGPAVRYKAGIAFPLQAAAAPAGKSTGDRKEQVLVVEGVRTGLRFMWEDDQRVVQLLNTEPRILKRLS